MNFPGQTWGQVGDHVIDMELLPTGGRRIICEIFDRSHGSVLTYSKDLLVALEFVVSRLDAAKHKSPDYLFADTHEMLKDLVCRARGEMASSKPKGAS